MNIEPIWKRISAEAKDLVTKLLQYFPEGRPSADKALHHPWIVKYFKAQKTIDGNLITGLEGLRCFRTQMTLQKAVLSYIW